MDDDRKVLGIPKDKYVKIVYIAVLISCAFSALFSVLSLVGIFIPMGGLPGLIGLIGLVLGLVGYFGFKEKFAPLDQNHLLYIVVLFGVLFVAGFILGIAFSFIPMLMYLFVIVLNIVQLVLFYTGYNSWKHGRTIGKSNLQSEIGLALKRA